MNFPIHSIVYKCRLVPFLEHLFQEVKFMLLCVLMAILTALYMQTVCSAYLLCCLIFRKFASPANDDSALAQVRFCVAMATVSNGSG